MSWVVSFVLLLSLASYTNARNVIIAQEETPVINIPVVYNDFLSVRPLTHHIFFPYVYVIISLWEENIWEENPVY